MNTAERTDEIEIPDNIRHLRTGESLLDPDGDTLDENEEEPLAMADIERLEKKLDEMRAEASADSRATRAELHAVREQVASLGQRMTMLESQAPGHAENVALRIANATEKAAAAEAGAAAAAKLAGDTATALTDHRARANVIFAILGALAVGCIGLIVRILSKLP